VRAAAVRPPVAPRVLTVRRALARPVGDPRRLLRAMRGLLVRRALALFGVLIALCLFHVWLRLQVTHLGYELSEAQQMRTRLEHEQRQLDVELAMLRDRGRLRELGRQRLGLVEPGKGQVLELR